MKKGRVFSGARPTGRQHLGNYLGAIKNYVALQDDYDCVYCIVDLHALTTIESTQDLAANTYEMALDWLAAGIRPEESVMFIQSNVPQVTELHTILSMVTPLGKLTDLPTFKEKVRQQPHNINYGLVGYPVLMSADIVLYKADLVPVGVDQAPHLEFARETVRSFNYRYNTNCLIEPAMKVTEFPKVLGIDGQQKMGKSLDNHIELAYTPDRDSKTGDEHGHRPAAPAAGRPWQPRCLQCVQLPQDVFHPGRRGDGQHRMPPGRDWLRGLQEADGPQPQCEPGTLPLTPGRDRPTSRPGVGHPAGWRQTRAHHRRTDHGRSSRSDWIA